MSGVVPVCPQCGQQSMFLAYDMTWRCERCYQRDMKNAAAPVVEAQGRLVEWDPARASALRDTLLERIATALEQSVEIQRRTLDLLERAGALMKEGDR